MTTDHPRMLTKSDPSGIGTRSVPHRDPDMGGFASRSATGASCPAEGIDQASDPPSVLVDHRSLCLGTSRDSSAERRIGIIDDQQESRRCSAYCAWYQPLRALT